MLVDHDDRARSGPAERGPGAGPRILVYAFLVVFALCALRGIEWWPMTGWKLFSQLRTGTAYGWEVVTVDGSGMEHDLDVGALPRGFHGVLQVAAGFPSLSQAARDEVCAAWVDASRDVGVDVVAVRVYRTRTPVRTDFDRPPPPAERTGRYDCS